METFQVFKDKNGEWRWRLWTNDDGIVATSGEGYVRRSDCIHHGIELVKTLSQQAEVKDSHQ